MSTDTIKQLRTRSAGRAPLGMIALLVLAAALVGAAVLLMNRGSNDASDTRALASQEEIDEELGRLQQALQTALQEKQDLARLAAQARVFTEAYPQQQGGYVLLAQLRMGMQQWPEAYSAWQRALSLGGQGGELHKMAGLCAAKMSRLDEALEHYKQAVALGAVDCEVFAALGRLHLALNDPDHAEQMFTQAIDARGVGEKTNYKHAAYAGLADVAAVRGDTAEALSWIDRAIKLAQLDTDADVIAYHVQKARIYMDAKRDDDAVTMLNYTWSQFPDSLWRIESARLRARLYERAGQTDRAVDYLQSIVEWHRLSETRDPGLLADFTALLADWQIKARRIDAAKVSLHNLQTLMPQHPAIKQLQSKLFQ